MFKIIAQCDVKRIMTLSKKHNNISFEGLQITSNHSLNYRIRYDTNDSVWTFITSIILYIYIVMMD
jgi:hypothetical protein